MKSCKVIIRFWLGGMLLASSAIRPCGAEPAWAAHYAKVFREAQTVFERQPTNAVAAWQLARAFFDQADLATNATQRAGLARQGIAVARESVRLAPDSAAASYYLGLNLGQLADATRSLGGLKLVGEMEQCFKRAGTLDASFDYAGPDRCLGLLYRDAPGWPISLGSRKKAGQHLERARELARDYPENHLNLLEGWLNWGERKKVAAEVETVEKVIVTARLKLTGVQWASSWADWNRRWRDIKAKAAEPSQKGSGRKGT
jgi:hypothetical protein